jgi:hypothetical protein
MYYYATSTSLLILRYALRACLVSTFAWHFINACFILRYFFLYMYALNRDCIFLAAYSRRNILSLRYRIFVTNPLIYACIITSPLHFLLNSLRIAYPRQAL